MLNKLKELETDSEGYIIQSAANRKILQQASVIFDQSINNSDYQSAIEEFLGSISQIDDQNSTYFNFISSGYKPNAQYISNLRKQTVNDLEGFLLNDGLDSQIKQPLISILNQNVNSSAKFVDLVDQMREYLKGNSEINGKLVSYSKQITYDSLNNYSRTIQQGITSDLGLVFYLYAGGLVEGGKYSSGSRPFCIERVGKYFHQAEIESWANLDWAGKRRGTTSSSIFTYVGGYFCGHALIPVDQSVVPSDVIERAKSLGLI